MIRKLVPIFILVVLFVAPVGTPVLSQDGTSVRSVTLATGEWAPYTSETFLPIYGSYGIAADIVVAAFQQQGFRPQLLFRKNFGLSYDLARDSTSSSHPVVAFPYFFTEQRQLDTCLSDPILKVDDVIFYDSKRAPPELGQITKLEELKKFSKNARFVADYCYDKELEEVLGYMCEAREGGRKPSRSNTGRRIEQEIAAFKALIEDDKVWLLPATEVVGRRILQTSFPHQRADIKIFPGFRKSREVHLAAPRTKSGIELVKKFNSGLAAIKAESGRYDALRNRLYPVRQASRLVRLNNPGDFPLVVGQAFKGEDGLPEDGARIVIPRGTTAFVVRWDASFLTSQAGNFDLRNVLRKFSLVKIVNGPLTGRLLWVKNMFIEIPAPTVIARQDTNQDTKKRFVSTPTPGCQKGKKE